MDSAQVKERPILMSAPMVRAILEGRKTQTRRVLKPQITETVNGCWEWKGKEPGTPYGAWLSSHYPDELCLSMMLHCCPYGKPGDRLWVRETFYWSENHSPIYRACVDSGLASLVDHTRQRYGAKWVPSIHMPRWASRITLEITDVRVERLQDITEEDAIAEGIEPVTQMGTYKTFVNYAKGMPAAHLPIDSYRTLWDSINGEGAWAKNPWVWAVSFRRVEGL